MEHQTIDFDAAALTIPGPAASARNAHDISRFLASMLSTADQEVVWSLTSRFFADLGFAHVLYGYSPDSRGPVLGAPEDYLILSTLPHSVISEMVDGGYYRMSVTFNWALNNAGLASWAMTPDEAGVGADFEVTEQALEFFSRHNMITGCTIGFPHERTRGRAVMALLGAPDKTQDDIDRLTAQTRDVIFTVAAVAHRCLSSLPYHPPGRRLTLRQREVLEWVGEGKTTADIALIMGITPPTVEKHLRLARETLGVETTAHALVKAAFLNQMFIAQPTASGGRSAVQPLDL